MASQQGAALPIVERVGLVTRDFGTLAGVREADLPEKKNKIQTLRLLSVNHSLGLYRLLLAHMQF